MISEKRLRKLNSKLRELQNMVDSQKHIAESYRKSFEAEKLKKQLKTI